MSICNSIIPLHVFVVRKYFEVEAVLAYARNPVSCERERVQVIFADRRNFTNQLYFMVQNHAGFSWTSSRDELTSISIAVSLKEY